MTSVQLGAQAEAVPAGRGARELEQGAGPDGRVRRGGTAPAGAVDAGLVPALNRLADRSPGGEARSADGARV